MRSRPALRRSEIRRCGVLVAVATSALLATSACGAAAAPPPAAAAPAAAPTMDHSMGGMDMGGMNMGGSGGTELWAVQTGPLGVIVTDGSGRMLYRSDGDTASPPASRCTGSCAAAWVPLRVTDGRPPQLEGVDQAKVGTVARPDGPAQVTLAGWPLYWHQGEAPGLATAGSNGADGTWFVANPSGGKAAS